MKAKKSRHSSARMRNAEESFVLFLNSCKKAQVDPWGAIPLEFKPFKREPIGNQRALQDYFERLENPSAEELQSAFNKWLLWANHEATAAGYATKKGGKKGEVAAHGTDATKKARRDAMQAKIVELHKANPTWTKGRIRKMAGALFGVTARTIAAHTTFPDGPTTK